MNNVSQTFLDSILKNHRKIHGKIIVHFSDSLMKTYTSDNILLMKFLEQSETIGDDEPFGSISIKSLEIHLNNLDRTFDIDNTDSEVSGLIRSGIKVEAFLGLEISGKIEYTSLGTFWARYWDIPESEIFAKIQCYDRLDLLKQTSCDDGKILISPGDDNLIFDNKAEFLQGVMTNAIATQDHKLKMQLGNKKSIQYILIPNLISNWVILNGYIYILYNTSPTKIIKYEATTLKLVATLNLASTTYDHACSLMTNGTYLFCICHQYLIKIDPVAMSFLSSTDLATPTGGSYLLSDPVYDVYGDYAYAAWAAAGDPDQNGWIKRIYIPSMNVVQTITGTIWDHPYCGLFYILFADKNYLYTTYFESQVVERRNLTDVSIVNETYLIDKNIQTHNDDYIFTVDEGYIKKYEKQSLNVVDVLEIPSYGSASFGYYSMHVFDDYVFAVFDFDILPGYTGNYQLVFKIFLGPPMKLIGHPYVRRIAVNDNRISGIYFDGNLLYMLINNYYSSSYILITDFYSPFCNSIF
ncbi:MAG TPA: hypothetical protein DDW65_21630 [Firmicutes bacterium]|nr:hypothetical protein [Bacillota bacterium]